MIFFYMKSQGIEASYKRKKEKDREREENEKLLISDNRFQNKK